MDRLAEKHETLLAGLAYVASSEEIWARQIVANLTPHLVRNGVWSMLLVLEVPWLLAVRQTSLTEIREWNRGMLQLLKRR